MNELKHKKIAIKLILFSLLGILISYQLKTPKKELIDSWIYFESRNITAPSNYYCINFFGFEVSYNQIFLFLSITLGVGIYLALFKNDNQLKSFFRLNLIKLKLIIGKAFKNIYNYLFSRLFTEKKTIRTLPIILFLYVVITAILLFISKIDKENKINMIKAISEKKIEVEFNNYELAPNLELFKIGKEKVLENNYNKGDGDNGKIIVNPSTPPPPQSKEDKELFQHFESVGTERVKVQGYLSGTSTRGDLQSSRISREQLANIPGESAIGVSQQMVREVKSIKSNTQDGKGVNKKTEN